MDIVVPTAREARASFVAMGVSGDALELMVRAGAPARHTARVAATQRAARTRAHELRPGSDQDEEALAGLLILGDLCGVGGPAGISGGGTDRAEWACSLGKGRKQASDGGAWMAACAAAIPTGLQVGVEDGPMLSCRIVPPSEGDVLPWGGVPPEGLCPIEREGLRSLVGQVLLYFAGTTGASEGGRQALVRIAHEDLPGSATAAAALALWASLYNLLGQREEEALPGEQHIAALQEWVESHGEQSVTVADSLAAGNCIAGTQEWLARHFAGREAVTVAELAAHVSDYRVRRVLDSVRLRA